MKKIVVLGGSGFVGRHVCEALNKLGWHVTVPTRRPPARAVQTLPFIDVVKAAVHNDADLNAIVKGHDAVINLVAILHGDASAFEKVHHQLPLRIAQACMAHQVHRLIHVSALGADLQGPSMYLRSKAQGEKALQDFSAQGLQCTLLRPSVIFGLDDAFINLFAKLQKWAPVMPLAGAHAQFQPIWVQDVAHAIVNALQNPSTINQTYELCGPDIFTLKQLVEVAGIWTQHPRWVIPLPDALARIQAQVMQWLPGPPLMSQDNLDSMRVPNIASGQLPNITQLGVTHPTPLTSIFI
ncbi:MAG: complex I NDUFA9 subunit family protein [Limnohabitans sp.]|nr:complex I NDUFA9 subunit family protein [Limnohabitans sp.]